MSDTHIRHWLRSYGMRDDRIPGATFEGYDDIGDAIWNITDYRAVEKWITNLALASED